MKIQNGRSQHKTGGSRIGLSHWALCIFLVLSLGWVAAVLNFKSSLEKRDTDRSNKPRFHAVNLSAAWKEPVLVSDGAAVGMLPKAVWHSKAPNTVPPAPARAAAVVTPVPYQAPSPSTPPLRTEPVVPQKNCDVELPSLSAELAKDLHSVQDRRSLDLAVFAWKRLLQGPIQVEYMRQRLCTRMKAWLTALTKMSWTRPVLQGGREITSALVWPQAAYLHFGVKRVWSLGEYTQWADLCAALATLGVEVTLWQWTGKQKKYPTRSDYEIRQVVYTDYDGVHGGKSAKALPPPDKTWLLDTFGTDGTVVQNDFFGRIAPLTDYPLHRFLTLVPGYSSRNTFLGVAAVASSSDRSALPPKKWQCLLWSKVHPWLAESNGFPAYHWKLLREYTKYCKVIATVDIKDTYKTADLIRTCCPEVEIREVQSPKAFQDLLLGSAVYVGVGEPLIAPSCFEALSLGTHVVQPRFPEPRQLKNKPITQNWTSQHPFLEEVPEPYAFTVDPLNFEALAETFRTLRQGFDSIYSEAAGPVKSIDLAAQEALRDFYRSGQYPGREEFSISGFLKRVAGTVTKTRTLEAADWDWERSDHPQQLPPRAFK